jgi:hypothetical protein
LASDLVVGIIFGVLVMGVLSPYRGVYWYVRELRKQVAFLKGPQDTEFPNPKEKTK